MVHSPPVACRGRGFLFAVLVFLGLAIDFESDIFIASTRQDDSRNKVPIFFTFVHLSSGRGQTIDCP
jgi:hypothetical protein